MKILKVASNVMMAIAVMFVMSVSQATTLTFEKITNNNDVDLTGQLSLDISSVGTTGVEFTFYNNVGFDSSLTDIYFDLGGSTIFSSVSVSNDSDTLAITDDVYFNEGAKTAVLPGGNGNEINFTSEFDAGAKNVKQGLDQGGEWVSLLATLGAGFSYADFMDGLWNGTHRIGLKIQSIADACAAGVDDCSDDSSTYINVVPLPAAAWLFGTALFGFFVTSRREKNS